MSLLSSSTASSLLKLNPLAPIHAAMGTIVTSQITPRVFVADWLVASNWDALDALGVTHVVSVCEIPPIVLGRQGHMHVCIVDLPFADISEHFEKTTKFIRDALSKEGTKVLVRLSRATVSTSRKLTSHHTGPLPGWSEPQHLSRLRVAHCREGSHREPVDCLQQSLPQHRTPEPRLPPPAARMGDKTWSP